MNSFTKHAETLIQVIKGKLVASDATELLEQRIGKPTVTLIDGRVVDSWSEDWRHECEAREILALPTGDMRRDRLAAIRSRRGPGAANALRKTLRAMYAAQGGGE